MQVEEINDVFYVLLQNFVHVNHKLPGTINTVTHVTNLVFEK